MRLSHRMAIIACVLLATGGCATRPRDFDAVLASPPADSQTYVRDFATCRYLVRNNFRHNTAQQAGVAVGSVFFILPGIVAAGTIRSDREKRLNQQMETCLTKYGYQVASWTRVRRSASAALPAAPQGETSQ